MDGKKSVAVEIVASGSFISSDSGSLKPTASFLVFYR
jgi:hypothetical protein